MASPKTMINLLDYTLPELTDWMQNELGEPKFRAVQVWQWIWQKMARDFDAMTNVSKACRERLAQCAEIRWPEIVTVEQSSDDTTKFLLRLQDGAEVETVLIPSDSREGVRRWTQCLSSQVGCAMACTFCSTGTMGFERNMTMGEILGQILVAREHLGDTRPDWPVLRNLVFMGMGEPLLNLKTVMRALESLNNDKGLNFSPRRITVSTCGIEKGLRELGESGLAYLAVSLHAPTQELRARIMRHAHCLCQLLLAKVIRLRAQAVLLCPTINGVCAEAQRRLKGPHAARRGEQRRHIFHLILSFGLLVFVLRIQTAASVVFLPQRAIHRYGSLMLLQRFGEAEFAGIRIGRAEV